MSQEIDKKRDFSIWHLGDDEKTVWISSGVRASTALEAFKKTLKDCDYKGLYLVVDPGYNPDSGWYGPTQFWLGTNLNTIGIVKKHTLMVGEEIKTEIEWIEI